MAYYPPVSPYAVGFACKCPRCGQGALYQKFLSLRDRCPSCDLDYAQADAGDGPAVFVIFIVGFLAVTIAITARFVWYWSIPAAFGISAVFTIIATIALLRPLKAVLIALQFRNKAEEGRLE